MSASRRYARQQFSYLERVVVFCPWHAAESHEGTIGEYALVVDWRRRNQFSRSDACPELCYQVRCLGTDRVIWVTEEQLVKTGDELNSFGRISDAFEISFDDSPPRQAGRIAGSFRLPGECWKTFEFQRQPRRESLYEIRLPLPGSLRTTMSLHYHVFERSRLDRAYVKRRMRMLFGGNDWIEVNGPPPIQLG
ncbi:MAG: hypothetical protein AB7O62_12810 [Pirellulales bacterium]